MSLKDDWQVAKQNTRRGLKDLFYFIIVMGILVAFGMFGGEWSNMNPSTGQQAPSWCQKYNMGCGGWNLPWDEQRPRR